MINTKNESPGLLQRRPGHWCNRKTQKRQFKPTLS